MNYLSYPLVDNYTLNSMLFPQNFYEYVYPQPYYMPFNSISPSNFIMIPSQTQEIKENKQKIQSRHEGGESLKKSITLIEQNEKDDLKLRRSILNKRKKLKNQKKLVVQKNCVEYQWIQQDQDNLSDYDEIKNSHLNKTKVYKQNPFRNIFTNIGNQLITYICSNKKSKKQLIKIVPGADEDYFKEFYQYSCNLKKQATYYLNLKKITGFWFNEQTQADKKFKKNIRALSTYYLRWVSPLSILSSKKLSRSLREFHLKARKTLINALKNKS